MRVLDNRKCFWSTAFPEKQEKRSSSYGNFLTCSCVFASSAVKIKETFFLYHVVVLSWCNTYLKRHCDNSDTEPPL